MIFTTLLIKMKAVASHPGPSISIMCSGSVSIDDSIYERTILREGGRSTHPTHGPVIRSCLLTIQHKFVYKIFSDGHKLLLGVHTVHADVVTSFRLLTLPTRKAASGLAVKRHGNGGKCRPPPCYPS